MAFVQLSDSDAVINVFPAKQDHITGYAEIADDDPRIATFDARQQAGMRLAQIKAAGCTIASTAMPALNTTWSLDATTMDQIGSVARDYKAGLGLPRGLTTFTYPDRDRTPVTLTGDQLSALYQALRDYTAAASEYLAGAPTDPPPQPFVIE
jgi:hypothetical protein